MPERTHRIKHPVPKTDLFLRRMRVEEELGRPFQATLEVFSPTRDIKGTSLLGKPLTISVRKPSGQDWLFNGMVSRFQNLGPAGDYQSYRLDVRPWLWFLTHTADCRIFQEMSVPKILEDVFKTKNSFSDFKLSLKGTYKPQEYCVQYRETDLDFVSRLMEHEGIYYYFEHTADKHLLVLCDEPASHPPLRAHATLPFRRRGEAFTGQPHVYDLTRVEAVQTGAYALTDYDFEKPNARLDARSLVRREHALASFERYDFPGEYRVAKEGERYAKIRLEELQTEHERVEVQAECHDLALGLRYKLVEHPRSAENGEYLITAMTTNIESGEIDQFAPDAQNIFDVQVRGIDSRQQFRPPRRTPKPIVQGPQTATVVGKQGEEIWTDKYGRVKVQFHWDRVGKRDENSSCWVRVAQVWAGQNWGGIEIPRIEQEVIVDFLEGDPDRPLITGRVYNFEQMPPYPLPDNATQSGVKSRSTKAGNAQTFNELRFEDKKDEEHIYFHAEKNFERVVENDDKLRVGFDKKDKGDQTVEIFNNQSLKVGCANASDGSQTIEIWNNRTETVKNGNESVTIEKGNREVKVQTGNDSLTISQGNLTIQISAGKCSITAAQSIELKVGGSSIKVEPASITLTSTQIAVKANAKAEVAGPMTSINGSAMVQVQGGVVKIN